MLVGGSCGMAVVAALNVARRADPSDVVVVLLPDGGRGYLSKIFNDEWMARYGFLRTEDSSVVTVAAVLAGKGGAMPEFVHVHPTETIRDAIDCMREYGVSQLPVLRAEPPVVTGEIAGSIAERDLLDALFTGHANLHDMVEKHMRSPLPMVGGGQPVSDVVALLEKADAAMVLVDGKPAGVITRQDLLAHVVPSRGPLTP
jgi:cystathionine beta-synthase